MESNAWQRLRDGCATPEEVAAARVLGALDDCGALNAAGKRSLAEAEARLAPQDKEWPLADLLEELREETGRPGGITTWLSRMQVAALLALLEVEHCKRRIEAAGWVWCDGPYGVYGLSPVGISRAGEMLWEEFATMAAAAEYAEAHAQGGDTDEQAH
jgi:hypothetical protein